MILYDRIQNWLKKDSLEKGHDSLEPTISGRQIQDLGETKRLVDRRGHRRRWVGPTVGNPDLRPLVRVVVVSGTGKRHQFPYLPDLWSTVPCPWSLPIWTFYEGAEDLSLGSGGPRTTGWEGPLGTTPSVVVRVVRGGGVFKSGNQDLWRATSVCPLRTTVGKIGSFCGKGRRDIEEKAP